MPKSRPNILHIFTDQQRFDTIHQLNNPIIRTPNLDRLCREGTAFTSAYSPSPVCVAARCSMIYGQYPMSTGCSENHDMPIDARASFMQALSDAGYRTHGIGKCHFSPDIQAMRGFQTRERQEEWVRDAAQDDYAAYLDRHGLDWLRQPHGMREECYYFPQPSPVPPAHHPTQWVADRSLDFLRAQDETQPWYLYSSFIHPHPPFAPPAPWHWLYRAPLMPYPHIPTYSDSLLTWVNHFQNRYKFRDQGQDLHVIRAMRAFYYACISFVDYQVGRLLAQLEAMGQLDNTLIIFCSDHGEYLGDYGCFGKRGMHDVSSRIPMICRSPVHFPADKRVDAVVSLVDLAPTICAAGGARITTHALDGVNLADVATGNTTRAFVFAKHGALDHATYMTVSKEWKYVYSVADRQEFLFDRKQDPQETRNIVGIPMAYPMRDALRAHTIKYLRDSGDTECLDGEGWRTFDGIHFGSEWQWWEMRTPEQFANNPNSGYVMGAAVKLGLDGYE